MIDRLADDLKAAPVLLGVLTLTVALCLGATLGLSACNRAQDSDVPTGPVTPIPDQDGDGVSRADAARPQCAGIGAGLAPQVAVADLLLTHHQGDAVGSPFG